MWNWRKTLFYKTSDSSRGVWALGFFSESHPKSSTAGTDLRFSFACWQRALPGVHCVCRQVSPSLPGVLPVKKHRPWNPLPGLCMTSATGQLSCLLIRENPWAREWWGGGRQPKGAVLLAWGAQPGVETPPSTPPAPWQGVLLQQFVIGGKKNPKDKPWAEEGEGGKDSVFTTGMKECPAIFHSPQANFSHEQPAGRQAHKRTPKCRKRDTVYADWNRFLRSACVEKLRLPWDLGCPPILGVKYICVFDLTGTALTTFPCHV